MASEALSPATVVELPESAPPAEDRPARAVPAWLISVSVHAALLLLFGVVVLVHQVVEDEAPPVRVTQIEQPPPKPPEAKRDLEVIQDTVIEIASDAPPTETPSPMTELDVPVESTSREEDVESEKPKGREEAVADSELGGEGGFMSISAGGGASGMFGARTGGGKRRALGRFGGSKGSENAVDAALRWFKKHQGADGSWKVSTYQNNCGDAGPKCEPGTAHTGADGDIACSGYAVLCFLGAGYDHRMPSKYKATVKRGLDWLVAQQKPDGSWCGGAALYSHGVASMAVAEAYAMSNDPALKDAAQKGITYIVSHQTDDPAGAKDDPYGGLGWDYGGKNATRNDSSVTGWQVMALKSGAAAGLNIGNGMEGAKRWLRKVWEANNPKWKELTDPYTAQSVFSYAWNPTTGMWEGHQTMAPVGALCAVFLGHHQGDIMLESLCNWIAANQTPQGYPTNIYYLYYNTLAIFQAGGPRWEKWNTHVRDILVNAQRTSQDCFDGSWDGGGNDFGVGRLLSTAYCCLSLEVYYRYLPVALGGGKQAAGGKR